MLSALAGCHFPVTNRGNDYQIIDKYASQGADQRIRFLVMHYTAEDVATSLRKLTEEQVSSHYLLPAFSKNDASQLSVYQLVPEQQRAWHAGESYWRGRSHLNDTSIGIEIVNQGPKQSWFNTRWHPYSQQQIALLIALSRDIVQRYDIKAVDVVAHSDISPQRKQDPGPLFPWQQLAEAGIGAWPDAATVEHYLAGRDRTAEVPIARLLGKLARYGYRIEPEWDASQQKKLLVAFQMHFRPTNYRGEPDAESEAIIDALLSKYFPAAPAS
ncbi:N-acetylmuramoyl-L-alanine amidase [Serratia microhaemolytica]|uniref:N-acetylmuramoyl-L-alanine amidase n=1 Tax=Serratia microhaemolytica TaxID=2675110 RepID=UPI000FDE8B01|nr:N-acetylmuramoyl-L-alanine amidase [Serratia microhaemolytica]